MSTILLPKTQHLVVFQEVIRSGSIGSAAKELGLTQPAVSKIINAFLFQHRSQTGQGGTRGRSLHGHCLCRYGRQRQGGQRTHQVLAYRQTFRVSGGGETAPIQHRGVQGEEMATENPERCGTCHARLHGQ